MDATDAILNRLITYIVDPILLVVFAVGMLWFMVGLVQFMLASSNGKDTKTGKDHMLYGIIGMVIMVSVYGIISLIDNTFNLNVSGTPDTSALNSINTTGKFVQ